MTHAWNQLATQQNHKSKNTPHTVPIRINLAQKILKKTFSQSISNYIFPNRLKSYYTIYIDIIHLWPGKSLR